VLIDSVRYLLSFLISACQGKRAILSLSLLYGLFILYSVRALTTWKSIWMDITSTDLADMLTAH
jgi:ABC-type nickel/cobalt efflux system permease component RcnA